MARTEKYTSIPLHLSHKPIYVMNGYNPVDGYYKNNTDVIGFSVGKALWAGEEFVPSVKVWRDVKTTDNGEVRYRISRQSEETTLTRALDMAQLIMRVLDANLNNVDLEGINSVHGQIGIEKANGSEELAGEFLRYIGSEKNDILSHIRDLKDAIDTFYRHTK